MADLERDGSEYFTVGEHISTSDERFDYRDTHRDNYLHHDGHGRRWHGDSVGDGHGDWGGAERHVFLQRQQRCGGTVSDTDVADIECDIGFHHAVGESVCFGVNRSRAGHAATDDHVCVNRNWPWRKRDAVRHRYGDDAAAPGSFLGELDQYHGGTANYLELADIECDLGGYRAFDQLVRIAGDWEHLWRDAAADHHICVDGDRTGRKHEPIGDRKRGTTCSANRREFHGDSSDREFRRAEHVVVDDDKRSVGKHLAKSTGWW